MINYNNHILYIISLLVEYDRCIDNNIKPNFDPYRDDIIINVNNIDVVLPKLIQRIIIIKWLLYKYNKIKENHLEKIDFINDENNNENYNSDFKYLIFNIGIYIVIIITIIFLLC